MCIGRLTWNSETKQIYELNQLSIDNKNCNDEIKIKCQRLPYGPEKTFKYKVHDTNNFLTLELLGKEKNKINHEAAQCISVAWEQLYKVKSSLKPDHKLRVYLETPDRERDGIIVASFQDDNTYQFELQPDWFVVQKHSAEDLSHTVFSHSDDHLAQPSENAQRLDGESSAHANSSSFMSEDYDDIDVTEAASPTPTRSKLSLWNSGKKTIRRIATNYNAQATTPANTLEADYYVSNHVKLNETDPIQIKPAEDISESKLKDMLENKRKELKMTTHKIWLMPIGVSESGILKGNHAILGVITHSNIWVIESKKHRVHSVETIHTNFQKLTDTTNCARYVAYTLVQLAKLMKLLKIYPESKTQLDKLVNRLTEPNDETIKQLFVAYDDEDEYMAHQRDALLSTLTYTPSLHEI